MGINEIGSTTVSLPINDRAQSVARDAANAGVAGKTDQNNPDKSIKNDRQASPEELKSAVEKIQAFVNVSTSDLNFSIDDASGGTVIKVIDRSTKEVIRQIPSEEMLEMSKALDRLQGLLVRNKA